MQWSVRQILALDTPIAESRQRFYVVRNGFTTVSLAESLDRRFNLGEYVWQVAKHY
jgi:hypothetical protein